MRKTNRGGMTPQQAGSVAACRIVAGELITDIATTWRGPKACQFSGTHAAWILYQAAMVPLLSLFSDYRDPDVVAECSRQVEVAMAALLDLRPWSLMAKQSFESVRLLYEASRRYSVQQHSRLVDTHSNLTQRLNASAQPSPGGGSPPDLDTNDGNRRTPGIPSHDQCFGNDILDDLNWYTNWDSIDYIQDLQDVGWENQQ